jgi:hypothetical protein
LVCGMRSSRERPGPYGTVKQSLRHEVDPAETVRVALGAVDGKVRSGAVVLDRAPGDVLAG